MKRRMGLAKDIKTTATHTHRMQLIQSEEAIWEIFLKYARQCPAPYVNVPVHLSLSLSVPPPPTHTPACSLSLSLPLWVCVFTGFLFCVEKNAFNILPAPPSMQHKSSLRKNNGNRKRRRTIFCFRLPSASILRVIKLLYAIDLHIFIYIYFMSNCIRLNWILCLCVYMFDFVEFLFTPTYDFMVFLISCIPCYVELYFYLFYWMP